MYCTKSRPPFSTHRPHPLRFSAPVQRSAPHSCTTRITVYNMQTVSAITRPHRLAADGAYRLQVGARRNVQFGPVLRNAPLTSFRSLVSARLQHAVSILSRTRRLAADPVYRQQVPPPHPKPHPSTPLRCVGRRPPAVQVLERAQAQGPQPHLASNGHGTPAEALRYQRLRHDTTHAQHNAAEQTTDTTCRTHRALCRRHNH